MDTSRSSRLLRCAPTESYDATSDNAPSPSAAMSPLLAAVVATLARVLRNGDALGHID